MRASLLYPRRRRLRRWARRVPLLVLGAALTLQLSFVLCDRLFPFPEDALERYGSSPVVLAADGTPMHVGLTRRGERLIKRESAEVPSLIRAAIIAAEDRRFDSHCGVDLRSVARAAWMGVLGRGRRQGASTITMQLARLLDPQPRTFAGKLVQAFRALQLERRFDKAFLLARYVDLVPFGGNLRGIEAAARSWFGKAARDLTVCEAALLASVLPAPSRLAPWRSPARARLRRNRVLDAMLEEGYLDEDTHAVARRADLGLVRTHFPDLAPHAWLRAGTGATAIDPTLQRAVEEIAATAGEPDGIAIVVVENATVAVRALVGAARADARVLDATRRSRSAGSTLKPLLYALALDRGLITLDTALLDLPWQSEDWAPSNFDQVFRGPVPARMALADSLNVPAVRLAAALPRGAFLSTLERSGFRHLRRGSAGPSVDLALGTEDVTALELAGAYAALANGGRYRRPWISASGRTQSEKATRVCSAGAATLVTRALADPLRTRPVGAPPAGVAWKTGTSSSRRDAWAAGYSARYTVVVWRGRLDGRPHPDLVGARAAVPLLFAVLQAADPEPRAFLVSPRIADVEVCSETGLRATHACPHTIHAEVPTDAAALESCHVHRLVSVDAETGRLCCPSCRERHQVVKRTVAIYGPRHAAWRARSGKPVPGIPPHAHDCPNPKDPAELRPVLEGAIRARHLVAGPAGARIDLTALCSDQGLVRLLVNGTERAVLASGARVELLLPIGNHHVTAITERGLQTTRRIEVSPATRAPVSSPPQRVR